MSETKATGNRIAIPLKAQLRFSKQIVEQLNRLEQRIRAEIPQLDRRIRMKRRGSNRS